MTLPTPPIPVDAQNQAQQGLGQRPRGYLNRNPKPYPPPRIVVPARPREVARPGLSRSIIESERRHCTSAPRPGGVGGRRVHSPDSALYRLPCDQTGDPQPSQDQAHHYRRRDRYLCGAVHWLPGIPTRLQLVCGHGHNGRDGSTTEDLVRASRARMASTAAAALGYRDGNSSGHSFCQRRSRCGGTLLMA